jgi:hypothetical protein
MCEEGEVYLEGVEGDAPTDPEATPDALGEHSMHLHLDHTTQAHTTSPEDKG